MIAQSALQVTRWLAALFAALSLLLLTERALGLGPAVALEDLTASYRALFYPLANFFEPLVRDALRLRNMPLPIWWRDGVVLYLMLGAAHFRHFTLAVSGVAGAFLRRSSEHAEARFAPAIFIIASLCAAIWPLSLALLPLIEFAVRAAAGQLHAFGGLARFYGEVLFQVAILATGMALFLLFDAGLR